MQHIATKGLLLAVLLAVAAGPATTRPTATSRPATRPTLAKPAVRPLKPSDYTIRDDAPEPLKKLWKDREKNRKAMIAREQSFMSSSDSKELTAKRRAKIDALKKAIVVTPDYDSQNPPAMDSAGDLSAVKVKQVIDADNVRVTTVVPDDVDLWLTGFDTSKLTDGSEVWQPFPVIIESTKQYHTAIGGTKTVMVAKAVVWSDYLIEKERTAGR